MYIKKRKKKKMFKSACAKTSSYVIHVEQSYKKYWEEIYIPSMSNTVTRPHQNCYFALRTKSDQDLKLNKYICKPQHIFFFIQMETISVLLR